MPLNGATNGTLVLPNVSASDAGGYCVVVSGACNRVTNCASLTVWVPVSATGPPSTTNCQGMAASLSVTARGSGPFVYQWSKDGVDLPGQASSNLALPNLTSAAAGNYCVVVSGVCNRVTNCASLTVLTPLSATGPVGQRAGDVVVSVNVAHEPAAAVEPDKRVALITRGPVKTRRHASR